MLNERMEMRINISTDFYSAFISSLVWSHNGTELTSNGRHSIGHNGISLTISNMVQSDAGKYEVKIHSTYFGDEGGICDKNILPVLANFAFYAPVTFILQEFSVPHIIQKMSSQTMLSQHIKALLMKLLKSTMS